MTKQISKIIYTCADCPHCSIGDSLAHSNFCRRTKTLMDNSLDYKIPPNCPLEDYKGD